MTTVRGTPGWGGSHVSGELRVGLWSSSIGEAAAAREVQQPLCYFRKSFPGLKGRVPSVTGRKMPP